MNIAIGLNFVFVGVLLLDTGIVSETILVDPCHCRSDLSDSRPDYDPNLIYKSVHLMILVVPNQ